MHEAISLELVVGKHQDGAPFERADRRLAGVFVPKQRQRKREGCALADFARDFDRASHLCHKLLADRQAETRTAKSP